MTASVATESCPPVALEESDKFGDYLATLTSAIREHAKSPKAFAAMQTPLARLFAGMDPAEALEPSNECRHGMLPGGAWLAPECYCWDRERTGVVNLECERLRRKGKARLADQADEQIAAQRVPLPDNVVALPTRPQFDDAA